MQHENTITRRFLLKLKSSSVNFTMFVDWSSGFDISKRKHAIAGTLRDRMWWTMRCWLIMFQTLRQIHQVASYSDRKFWTVKYYRHTDRTNISRHSTTGNVVQSYKVNNATPARLGQHESNYWMKQSQAINETIIILRTSSMITVPCA